MSTYQLYGTNTGSADGVASIDVQFDGLIVAWNAWYDSTLTVTADDFAGLEISFLSVNTATANDARGVIFSLANRLTLVTSGATIAGGNGSLGGLSIPVSAGERIYMHLFASAGNVVQAIAQLYVEDQSSPQLRRRR